MLTKKQINFLNDKYCIWEYIDGVININCEVYIPNMNLTRIPVKFGNINGYVDCRRNKLTTLYGVPKKVKGTFNCDSNSLTSLKSGPEHVDLYYSCDENQLTSLIGAPNIANDDFYCCSNTLTSLKGCPRRIKGNLWCLNNRKLHILYGIGKVEGTIEYEYVNDLNEWIIEQARKDIFVTAKNIADWIKKNNKLIFLRGAQKEIRRYFSSKTLSLVDVGILC